MSTVVGVSREEVEAALKEWPRTHRSILLQGQRLSVEENCLVIIDSLEDEVECQLTTTPAMVSAITFLLTVVAVFVVTLLGTVAILLFIHFICAKRSKKK